MKKTKIPLSKFKIELFINDNNKHAAFITYTCGSGWSVEGSSKEEVAEKIKQFIITNCTFESYD